MDEVDALSIQCSNISLDTGKNEVSEDDTGTPKQLLNVSNAEMVRIMTNLSTFTTNQLREILKNEKQSTEGKKKDLQNRVRKFYKKHYLLHKHMKNEGRPSKNKTLKHFQYLVFIDFECTCQANSYDYPHEIIQFPAVLVDVKSLKIIDSFNSFVKPTINPVLDDFCIRLCGITQEDVESAPPFKDVVQHFYEWIDKHSLGKDHKRFAFVTDGYHDFWKFLQFQYVLNDQRMPSAFRYYINMRRIFEYKVAKIPRGIMKTGIESMLRHYNLSFEGKIHNGLDDAHNMARICIEMMKNKIELTINERLVRKRPEIKREQVKIDDAETKAVKSDFNIWKEKLGLIFERVSKQEFTTGEYLDAESCDEE